MKSITILTDSTSDIPEEYINRYDIHIIPLTVHLGNESYRDWYDLTSEEFYKKLADSNIMPTTSQVTPHTFAEEYRKELEKGNSIISIHLSSKLSGTYQAAVIAKQQLDTDDIDVIDSKNVSFGMGMIVLEAAKLRNQGKSKKEIVHYLKYFIEKQKCYFSVDTLEYLRKGGRLSAAKAVMGTVLNIKPVLEIKDGAIEVIDKVRGRKKVIPKLLQLAKEGRDNFNGKIIGIGHASMPEAADNFARIINNELNPKKIIISSIGSVIGAHAGPGTIGLFFERL